RFASCSAELTASRRRRWRLRRSPNGYRCAMIGWDGGAVNVDSRLASAAVRWCAAVCVCVASTCWNAYSPTVVPPVFLRVTQIGYRAKDVKSAVAFSASPLPQTFAVVSADTGQSIFQGKIIQLAGERWGSFDRHAELEFTEVTEPGRYVVRMGETESLP